MFCLGWKIKFGDRLHVFPILLGALLPLTFIITYILAVASGHVHPAFPFISDTGTTPPESCVFGQLLNIGAVLAIVVFYIRYRQIGTHYERTGRTCLLKCNTVTFVMGIMAGFGISVVGNFQETNVIVVHYMGAFLAFAVGSVYCWIQTGMSFKMEDIPGNSAILRIVRVIMSVLTFAFFIMLFIFASLSSNEIPPETNVSRIEYWEPGLPGFNLYVVGTVSEWLLALLSVFFLLTYVKEFKLFRMQSPVCYYRTDGTNDMSLEPSRSALM